MAKPTYRVISHPYKDNRYALELKDGPTHLQVYGAAGHVVDIEQAREHYYPKIFMTRDSAVKWMTDFHPEYSRRR